MKIKEFPLMHEFFYGAFSSNSGGQREQTGNLLCTGTIAQWTAAEDWLRDYTRMMTFADAESEIPANQRQIAWMLGSLADEGQSVNGMFYAEENPFDIIPSDNPREAPPYLILNDYY